ncbi:MAG: response regulator [Alphaproteobacteria bacterium]
MVSAHRDATAPKTILLVEDDETLRATISTILRRDGYRVVAAGNGAEALGLLDESRPDLILSDRMMPTMSGFELLEVIRRDRPDLAPVPFVFLTALGDRRDMMATASLKPAAYLTKPVRARELCATLGFLLGVRDRPAPAVERAPT